MFSRIHAFVHDGVYCVRSGAGTGNYRFLMSLVRLGYGKKLVVSPVWTPSWNSDFDETWFLGCKELLDEAGAQLVPVDNGSHGKDRYGWVDHWRTSSQRAFELVRETAETGKTLVLSFDSPFMGLIPLLADMPDIVHVHVPRGTGMQHTPGCFDRLQYERESFRRAGSANTWVGAISTYMGEHLTTEYDIPRDKLLPIHCGVLMGEHEPVTPSQMDRTLTELDLKQSEKFLLSFGRAEPYKGFHTILEALMLLETPPTLVLIAALVDPRDEYMRRLQSLIDSARSRVCLVGNFDFWTPRVLQQAPGLLAVIVPSLVEPFGLIATEVLTNPYGTGQLVCSRTGGLAEQIVDGETGFLFAPGDAADLAAVLAIATRASDEERTRMKERTLAHRHRFDILKNVATLLSDLGRRTARS